MLVDFQEYRDNLILISKLYKLPKTIEFNGTILNKGFADSNMIEYSHYLSSPNLKREVFCGYRGRNEEGLLVFGEVRCFHYNLCGDKYIVSVIGKEILNKLLEEKLC